MYNQIGPKMKKTEEMSNVIGNITLQQKPNRKGMNFNKPRNKHTGSRYKALTDWKERNWIEDVHVISWSASATASVAVFPV